MCWLTAYQPYLKLNLLCTFVTLPFQRFLVNGFPLLPNAHFFADHETLKPSNYSHNHFLQPFQKTNRTTRCRRSSRKIWSSTWARRRASTARRSWESWTCRMRPIKSCGCSCSTTNQRQRSRTPASSMWRGATSSRWAFQLTPLTHCSVCFQRGRSDHRFVPVDPEDPAASLRPLPVPNHVRQSGPAVGSECASVAHPGDRRRGERVWRAGPHHHCLGSGPARASAVCPVSERSAQGSPPGPQPLFGAVYRRQRGGVRKRGLNQSLHPYFINLNANQTKQTKTSYLFVPTPHSYKLRL